MNLKQEPKMGCNQERGTVRADKRKKIAKLYLFELERYSNNANEAGLSFWTLKRHITHGAPSKVREKDIWLDLRRSHRDSLTGDHLAIYCSMMK